MKTLCTISIAAASLFAAGTAQAQYQAQYGSNSAPWSYDGQTQYASQADCERARTTRTLGGAAVGGLIGAGLGAFAGGDDRRNSVVGAAVGAATGGYAGNRSLKCEQTSAYAPSQQPTYTGYSQQPAQVYYPQQQPQTVYNQPTPYPVYQTSYPAPVTTTRTRTVYTAPAPTRTVYSQPTYTTHAPSHTSSSTTRRVYTQTQTYPSQQHQYGGYQTASYPTRTPVYTPVQQQRSPVYTHDNRSFYPNVQSCETARRNRTLAGGGAGALAGAAVGILAGGDDGRNAALGGALGGVAGAVVGHRSVQCQAVYR